MYFLLVYFRLYLLQSPGNSLLWGSAVKNLQPIIKPCCLWSCGMPQFPSLQQGSCTAKAAVPAAYHGAGWHGLFLSHSRCFLWLRTAVGFAVPCPFEFPVLFSFSAASGGECLSFRLGESWQKFAGWQQHRFYVCHSCCGEACVWWVFVTLLNFCLKLETETKILVFYLKVHVTYLFCFWSSEWVTHSYTTSIWKYDQIIFILLMVI